RRLALVDGQEVDVRLTRHGAGVAAFGRLRRNAVDVARLTVVHDGDGLDLERAGGEAREGPADLVADMVAAARAKEGGAARQRVGERDVLRGQGRMGVG